MRLSHLQKGIMIAAIGVLLIVGCSNRNPVDHNVTAQSDAPQLLTDAGTESRSGIVISGEIVKIDPDRSLLAIGKDPIAVIVTKETRSSIQPFRNIMPFDFEMVKLGTEVDVYGTLKAEGEPTIVAELIEVLENDSGIGTNNHAR